MNFVQMLKFYNQDRLAASYHLSVTTQTLRNWEQNGIPGHRQLAIETLTKGKLKADREVQR